MQLHPEFVRALLAERERDLAARVERRRPVRSGPRTGAGGTWRALSISMPRGLSRSDAPR